MTQPTSTANYRKYPKGPNFLLVVILAGVAMIAVCLIAVLVLRSEGKKLVPKVPDKHPTSQITPQIMPRIIPKITPLRPPSSKSAAFGSDTRFC